MLVRFSLTPAPLPQGEGFTSVASPAGRGVRCSGLRHRRRRGRVRLGWCTGGWRVGLRRDLDCNALAQLELACRDDEIAVGEALHDLGLAFAPLANVDFRPLRLAINDAIDEPFVALRHDRLLR